jgi:cytochrome c5
MARIPMMPLVTTLLAAPIGPAAIASASGQTAGSAPELYAQACAVCHGADGRGSMPGVPDLAVAKGPLSQPETVLVERVIKGYRSPGSGIAMPPRGGSSLTDEQIRAVVGFMKQRFLPSEKR